MGGIEQLAETVATDMEQRLPGQRKTQRGKLALLVSWQDAKAASQWTPVKAGGIQSLRHRRIRIVRDYGMFDRREAPQFHPDAKGRETRHAERAHRGGSH